LQVTFLTHKKFHSPLISGEPTSLSVFVKNRADFYNVGISVTGHEEVNMLVRGAPNIENVFLQSDKTFYRSNETGMRVAENFL
jgi:hypothetical protein